MDIVIGTAGWSVPAAEAPRFGPGETTLRRYATRFGAVEINSSFHRPHRRSTWQRWRDNTPANFRFAAKLPKTITHVARLEECEPLLDAFLGEVAGLGDKLAVLLVQLPPKLAFDRDAASSFFAALTSRTEAAIACEPRHASWFEPAAGAVLEDLRVARVAADPACVPAAAVPGGWGGLAYWRLHGSPRMYRSSYDDGRLDEYAAAIRQTDAADTWCMFDNTASSAATGDALALTARLGVGWMPDEDSNLD